MDNMIDFTRLKGAARGGIAEVFGTWQTQLGKAEEPPRNAKIQQN
jgi:hypothetical protein